MDQFKIKMSNKGARRGVRKFLNWRQSITWRPKQTPCSPTAWDAALWGPDPCTQDPAGLHLTFLRPEEYCLHRSSALKKYVYIYIYMYTNIDGLNIKHIIFYDYFGIKADISQAGPYPFFSSGFLKEIKTFLWPPKGMVALRSVLLCDGEADLQAALIFIRKAMSYFLIFVGFQGCLLYEYSFQLCMDALCSPL